VRAIANGDNVADWEGGKRMIDAAVEAFGDLHVLVNNAGILRDRVLVNMTEEEWDAVIHVHLKGHFVPARHAAAYWREQSKAGKEVKASIINTSSTSGLLGNPGQTNYGAAKAGIAAFSSIAATELSRYGVRSNCIARRHARASPRPRRAWATSSPRRPTRASSMCGTRPTCRRWWRTSPPRTARLPVRRSSSRAVECRSSKAGR